DCVAGVDWDTVSKNDWKARKKALRTEKQAFIEIPVTRGDQNTMNTGVIAPRNLGDNKTRTSLAARVAHTFKSGTIIAVEQVAVDDGSESFWFCAVRDGQVIAGTDILGDYDTIDYQVSEII